MCKKQTIDDSVNLCLPVVYSMNILYNACYIPTYLNKATLQHAKKEGTV